MHEMSLIQGVLDSVLPVARDAGATSIDAITLDIGDMTMVVPEAMDFAFEALSDEEPLLDGCQLVMNFIKPRSRCLDCGTEFDHDRFHLRCPECESGTTLLLRGREMQIASIEVETPDDE